MPITTSLQLTARFEVGWIFTNDLDISGNDPTFSNLLQYKKNFANGTGNDQADELWVDRRTLTPSTPTDDLDLSGTSLQNAYGRDLNLSVVKGFLIVNLGKLTSGDLESGTFTPTSGEDLLVGATGAAANFFADIFDGNETARKFVKAGGAWGESAPLDGYTVTGASSGDIFRVFNDGSDDITYDVAIWGVKA